MTSAVSRFRWLSCVLGVAALLGACGPAVDVEAQHKLADTYTQLGSRYLQRGQLEAAKENLDKAVELDPDNVEANNAMAFLQWRLKNPAAAERYFRKALDVGGSVSDTWNNFGVFLCDTGKLDEAEQAFKRALADPLYKTPAEANVNAGMCQMRKPSPMSAERYFRAALDINAQQPQALLEMAKLTYNDGRTLSARAFIQRYFAVAPETPASLLLANRIEGALGNVDAEASYAVKLRGKFPDAAEVAQLKAARPKPRAPAPKPKK